MVECKLCEQEIGNFGDYDTILKHAEEYHFDIYEYFPPEEIRDLILLGDLKGVLKNNE
jgi:hypothetical protein